jgi:hypothetical protein
MIQQRRAARGDAHEDDPDLAVVLLAQPAVVLPGCRATPALWSPFLAKPLSSTTPTTPIGLLAAVETNSSTKTAWTSAWTSSGSQGALLRHFCSAETWPSPTFRAIGSMLVRSGQTISPLTEVEA